MDKRILLEAFITEREGMIAENQHRLQCGHSPAYGDEHFQTLADQIRALATITAVQGDAERGGVCEHMDKGGTFCHQIGDVVQDRTP